MNKIIIGIVAVLLMFSMAGIVSASEDPRVNVLDPAYENAVTVTWSDLGESPVRLIITHGDECDFEEEIHNSESYVVTDYSLTIETQYTACVSYGSYLYYGSYIYYGPYVYDDFFVEADPVEDESDEEEESDEEQPIEVSVQPIISTFNGYTFGTSDCNRMAILMGQLPGVHAWRAMEDLSWSEHKFTVSQMYDYCVRNGANMTPITDYYEWSPE